MTTIAFLRWLSYSVFALLPQFSSGPQGLNVDDFSEIILQTLEVWLNLVIVVQSVQH